MAQQQQRDAALEAFDGLKVCSVVENLGGHTPFLAKFRSAAASLKPDERIKVEVVYTRKSMEWLKAVLASPHASKLCSLHWKYRGNQDVNSVIPLLINSCPELASLQVYFKNHSEIDFFSSVLEHPSNKIKVLQLPKFAKGDIPRFFTALGQSQVSALTIFSWYSPEFYNGLYEYLAKDLLVRLEVDMDNQQVPSELMMSLAKCTRLAELRMLQCDLRQPTALVHLPRFITTLKLSDCTFVDGFDWSFLADSSVRELDFVRVEGVDGSQLGGALAACLRAKGLDELHICDSHFVNAFFAVAGLELGRIKRLMLERVNVSDASIALISCVLQSPNSEITELVLPYYWHTLSSIENHLVSALRHPYCNLAKLSLCAHGPDQGAAKTIEARFRKRRALFVLLQGQQIRRLYCPLRRLPVEMFRLVGQL